MSENGSFYGERRTISMSQFLKTLLPKVQAYPVKRGMSDREAFRKTIKLLREDKVVGFSLKGQEARRERLEKVCRRRILCVKRWRCESCPLCNHRSI